MSTIGLTFVQLLPSHSEINRLTPFQSLLSEYLAHQGGGGGPLLEAALDRSAARLGDLRRQLDRAVVDHVSIVKLQTQLLLLLKSP